MDYKSREKSDEVTAAATKNPERRSKTSYWVNSGIAETAVIIFIGGNTKFRVGQPTFEALHSLSTAPKFKVIVENT